MRAASRTLGRPLGVSSGWLFACVLSMPIPLRAEDTSAQARTVINQMTLATKSLNYDGTFVYIRGSHVASMRVIHKTDDKGEQERLISLSGPAREVIRKRGEVTCIFPDNRAVMVDKSPPHHFLASTLPQPIEKIADFYSFSVLGGDRIAGRPTWVVGIMPKEGDRYGYRLWIDTSIHLLLRSNIIDASGKVLEQVLFTAIETPRDISAEMLKPAINGQGYTWYTNETPTSAAADAKAAGWRIGWLPQGFVMREHKVHAMALQQESVNHIIVSDGLATVSVFVERLKRKTDQMEGLSSVGAVNTYSTIANGHQITVVGEMPAATLRQIAASVSPSSGSP